VYISGHATFLEEIMALTINTNVSSLNAQRHLSKSQNELSTAMERLADWPSPTG